MALKYNQIQLFKHQVLLIKVDFCWFSLVIQAQRFKPTYNIFYCLLKFFVPTFFEYYILPLKLDVC